MGVSWSFSHSGLRPHSLFCFCFHFTFDSSKSKLLAPFITCHSEVLSKVLETYFACPYNFLVSEQIPVSWKKKRFCTAMTKNVWSLCEHWTGFLQWLTRFGVLCSKVKWGESFQNLVKKIHWAHKSYHCKKLITQLNSCRWQEDNFLHKLEVLPIFNNVFLYTTIQKLIL